MESDGLQSFYLMNTAYAGKQMPATNMFFLNSAGNQLNQPNLPHTSQQNQQFVGIPLQAQAAALQDPNPPSFHYNLLTSMNSAAVAAAAARSGEEDGGVIANMASELGLRQSVAPQAVARSQQGLSLSLSQQYVDHGNEMRIAGSSASAMAISNGISALQRVLMSSKYLKAAQQLLDEFVNVERDTKSYASKGTTGQKKANRDSPVMEASGGAETNEKRAAGLSTAERQELQMKKAKLISMLDEVDERYRQYHRQMQTVASSFEAAAGIGSAKTYTSLAWKTISKQFRCLKDAITGQIKAVSISLGEEDCSGGGKVEGLSRLRFMDRHLRQQRAVQQLGTMQQHNAWRPQRGLPEKAVSVLRAWLFEHFLHPYPKDSEKLMLAKQSGLTRGQVSNWFINARVRLWKPMVEEMYLEETKKQEQNGSDKKTSKSDINAELEPKSIVSPARKEETNNFEPQRANIIGSNAALHSLSKFSSTTSTSIENAQTQSCFSLTGSSQATLPDKQKKSQTDMQNSNIIAVDLRSDDANNGKEFYMKFGSELNRDECSIITGTATGQEGSFGAYPMGEMRRLNPEQLGHEFSGSGFSLTLGLPHSKNLSLSGALQTSLPSQNIPLGRRFEMGNEASDFGSVNSPTAALSANAYGNINIQNRKQFPTRMLPDFVA